MTPTTLFLNHAAVLGGAELTLGDIVGHFGARGRVLLFSDGPFRQYLEAGGIAVDLMVAHPALMAAKREERGARPAAVLATLGLARRVARVARRHDVLYANTEKAFVVAAFATALAHKPVVWYLHDILSREHFSASRIATVISLSRLSSALVLTHSQACVDAFVARGGRSDRIRRVPYGVDPGPFQGPACDDVSAVRAELGFGASPCVGVFGRLAPWKGQHILVDALPKLPGVHALLAGDALFGEEAYREHLWTRARQLGVADRLHLVGFRSDIPTLMNAVDIVMHTSVAAEPFGRVIVEGMLAGRPVVATRAGGPLEIVQDGVTGLLATPGNAEELAAAVAELIAAPDRRRAMGAAGRERANRCFTRAAMCASVAAIVEEALRP